MDRLFGQSQSHFWVGYAAWLQGDLEGAVAPDVKESARDQVMAAVSSKAYGPREVVVRVNGLSTPWGADDLRAAAAAGPDAVLIPKPTSAQDVTAIRTRAVHPRGHWPAGV